MQQIIYCGPSSLIKFNVLSNNFEKNVSQALQREFPKITK